MIMDLREKIEFDHPKLFPRPIFIECLDGWLPLIYELCSKLEPLIFENIDKDMMPHCVQIKEKFGGLRFYMSSSSEQMDALIMQAEKESYKICEVCGNPGTIIKDKWIKTKCKEHV